MESINHTIAEKLKRIRHEKGLSLERASELTGVSKAMLGQIERGASNPTVSILWKIANGLKVSFSSFVEEDEPPVSVVELANIAPVVDADGKYRVFPMFPFSQEKQFEMYTIYLEAGYTHESAPHPTGVEEYVTVFAGTLTVRIGEQTYVVKEGNGIRFKADREHAYVNTGEETVIYQNLIYYPS